MSLSFEAVVENQGSCTSVLRGSRGSLSMVHLTMMGKWAHVKIAIIIANYDKARNAIKNASERNSEFDFNLRHLPKFLATGHYWNLAGCLST